MVLEVKKKNGNFCLFFDSFIHVSIILVLCTLLHPLLPFPLNSSISFSPFPLECFVTHRVQLVLPGEVLADLVDLLWCR